MSLELRIQGQAPPVPGSSAPAWLGYGFRPFFLGAALLAPVLVLFWVTEIVHAHPMSHPVSSLLWHGHEMVYGFAASVVAGFLLTAVPNWTGIPTPRGWPLGALFALWLLPRLGMLGGTAAALPWLAGLDLAFYPALAVALAAPLLHARKLSNLAFLPILLALTAGNACFWAQALGYWQGGALLSRHIGVGLLLLLIGIIGGRVIPFFARRAIPGLEPRSYPIVEHLSAPFLVWAIFTDHPAVAAAAGVLQLWRLSGWLHRDAWRHPLLWVLFVAYGFLGLGFLLKATVGPALALHAHTVGCIGLMILGMMARVALGHSGRELKAARATVAAFVLLTLAAITRGLLPALAPSYLLAWWEISGCLWALAFALFALVYVPILVRPRADGKPG